MVKRYGIEGELIYQKDDGHVVRYEDYEILHQKFDGASHLCEEAMRINCEWEKAMMDSIGEDGIGSVTKAIEKLKADKQELQQKLDAMAAENAAQSSSLKALATLNNRLWQWTSRMSYNSSYVGEPEGLVKGHIREMEKILDGAANKTPATDAYLNSVRAEGVDLVKSHPAISLVSLTHICDQIAEQLRSGTHDTADKAG